VIPSSEDKYIEMLIDRRERELVDLREALLIKQAEIERLCLHLAAQKQELERMCQEVGTLTYQGGQREIEIERLRNLLRDARDDVAELAGQQTKQRHIEAYREQLAEIDAAIGAPK